MLLLLPNLLSPESTPYDTFTPSIAKAVSTLNGLIAESPKGGRIFLKHFGRLDLPQTLLNEHTKDLAELLEPLKKGECWGLVSDCGLPCLADPGRELVLKARALNIPVKAYSGPSSIPLALMLSGLPAQAFTFHGYLEREPERLVSQLLTLQTQKITHLFIEAPYRNEKLLTLLIKSLRDNTMLSVASDLTGPAETVHTHPIRHWKKLPLPPIDKKPAIFLFYP
ncbi:MAG: SAM-dependent methyltransferase [Chlamydiota bacterium]